MKFSATLLSLALATGAVAQIPSCAQTCVDPFLQGGIGECGSDSKCICGSKDFIDDISCCLSKNCGPSDQSVAVNFASVFCGGLGVTTLPTVVVCSSTASGSAKTTDTAATTTAASTSATNTGTAGGAANTSKSGNYGPRQTAAPLLGAIGGLVAAVALL